MKTVEFSGNDYYVNRSPSRKEHCGKLYIYLHKNYQGDPIYLNDILEILKDVRQPTAGKVASAMIWSHGYEGEYKIKCGGESMSDRDQWSSSIVATVPHPESGDDMNVVILKKYSSEFKDVLITADEIEGLYELCKTSSEEKEISRSKMQGCIGLLLRIARGCKIKVNGKEAYAPAETVQKLRDSLHEVATDGEIGAYLDELMVRNKNYNEKLLLLSELKNVLLKEVV